MSALEFQLSWGTHGVYCRHYVVAATWKLGNNRFVENDLIQECSTGMSSTRLIYAYAAAEASAVTLCSGHRVMSGHKLCACSLCLVRTEALNLPSTFVQPKIQGKNNNLRCLLSGCSSVGVCTGFIQDIMLKPLHETLRIRDL
jgi:hypothetical protein